MNIHNFWLRQKVSVVVRNLRKDTKQKRYGLINIDKPKPHWEVCNATTAWLINKKSFAIWIFMNRIFVTKKCVDSTRMSVVVIELFLRWKLIKISFFCRTTECIWIFYSVLLAEKSPMSLNLGSKSMFRLLWLCPVTHHTCSDLW